MLVDPAQTAFFCTIHLLLLHHISRVGAFLAPVIYNSKLRTYPLRALGDDLRVDAEELLAKANAIRKSIPSSTSDEASKSEKSKTNDVVRSQFALPIDAASPGSNRFRLDVDIGRERGTWMDPRWGASGRRIELTLEVSFSQSLEVGDCVDDVSPEHEDIAKVLLKSVTSKMNSVSKIYKLNHAPYARLKGGFDKMKVHRGGYCTETSSSTKGPSTLRFCISVAGTSNSSYGDVSIPEGELYFAIPYFGTRFDSCKNKTMVLSTKEGTVTVRQVGWNTGWRREESRILGTFRVVPLNNAR